MRLETLLTILSLTCLTQAITLSGTISVGGPGYEKVFQKTVGVVGSKVVLDHGSAQAFIDRDGAFKIYDVPDGEHVLAAHVPGYAFQPLLISIPADSAPHIQLSYPGRAPLSPSTPSLPYPIQLFPLGKEDYYSSKSGVNILGLLKSPIVLMMLASAGLMFVLPKVMASVEGDEELKKEMAEARKRMGGGMSGLLRGATESEAPASNTNGAAGAGKGNARRRK